MRILVIEDAPHIRDFLVQGLSREGYQVEEADNIQSARDRLVNHEIDLLLVDRMLPDGDGLDLIREARRSGKSIAAICLTGMDRVDERVEGIRSGADDYISKPFAFVELLARIDAVTRRSGRSSEVVVGPLRLDISRHLVEIDGQPAELTAREFAVLTLLVRNKGQVLSRNRLLDEVWGIQHSTRTNVVDVYIRYLRAKLGEGLIHTIRGVGYVLDPDRDRTTSTVRKPVA